MKDTTDRAPYPELGYTVSKDIGSDIRSIILSARDKAYRSINKELVMRNWLIGRRIAEEELAGDNSENYGRRVIKQLSASLTEEFGRGFSERSLYAFTQFYRMFPEMLQTLSAESRVLSWSHYQRLLTVHNDKARDWYHKEALDEGWSVRTLDRNIATQYYFRLLKSPEPEAVIEEMRERTSSYEHDKHLEFIKNPVVAEFLGLPQSKEFSEMTLETAILDDMQSFLLEMGKGYAFVARQKHVRTELNDFYIDLVFYNIDLRCFVLIDLKIGELTHQDIGQMDMYVRMYDELERRQGDDPTIGIILCSETDKDVVHYSMLKDKDRLFAAKYLTYLPSEEELRAEIEAQKAIYYSEHSEGSEEEHEPLRPHRVR